MFIIALKREKKNLFIYTQYYVCKDKGEKRRRKKPLKKKMLKKNNNKNKNEIK